MPIDIAHYHGWSGRLRGPWYSSLAVARATLRQVFRRKLLWVLLALGLFNFLLYFALIYASTQFPRVGDRLLERMDFVVRPDAQQRNGYLRFIEQQGLVVMMLLAFAGSVLIGGDFRQRGVAFYLAHGLHPVHYLAGKWLAVAGLLALVTALPALVLFLEYGLFTNDWHYWWDNRAVIWSVLGYTLVMAVVLGVLLLALGAWLHKTVPIAITWTSLLVLSGAVAGQLASSTGNRDWLLLNLWRNVRVVGRWFFGFYPRPEDRLLAPWAAGILAGLVALCLGFLWWQLVRLRRWE